MTVSLLPRIGGTWRLRRTTPSPACRQTSGDHDQPLPNGARGNFAAEPNASTGWATPTVGSQPHARQHAVRALLDAHAAADRRPCPCNCSRSNMREHPMTRHTGHAIGTARNDPIMITRPVSVTCRFALAANGPGWVARRRSCVSWLRVQSPANWAKCRCATAPC